MTINIALSGLAHGDELSDDAARLAKLHPPRNTLPGELMLDLAADAIGISGATRRSPIEFEHLRDRYLPEGVAHSKAEHHKSKFALRTAAMLQGGVDPGLLDEVQWCTPMTCGAGHWRRSSPTSVPPPSAPTSQWPPCAIESPPNGASPCPTTPRHNVTPRALAVRPRRARIGGETRAGK